MEEWWQREGYLYAKALPAGLWICLAPMIFTYRLMLCSDSYVYEFYCYPKELGLILAGKAFDDWTGRGEPIPGWVKFSGDH